MALNNFNCNCLTPLHFKGLMERKDNLSLSHLLVDCLETGSALAQLSMGLLLPFTYIMHLIAAFLLMVLLSLTAMVQFWRMFHLRCMKHSFYTCKDLDMVCR